MSALLSPVQEGDIWRVKIVWPNRAVHHFGKFTSKRDAVAWINAPPRLTKPVAELSASTQKGDMLAIAVGGLKNV
jgi:hypothetical protein